MSGAVYFRGTRLPVAHLFENLQHGLTVEEFMETCDSPVTREQIDTVFAFVLRWVAAAGRHEHERPEIPLWPNIPTFCTGREPKVRHMRRMRIEVDVWIEDDPRALLGRP